MKLISRVFKQGQSIPSIYTCDGKGWNPPLEISQVPENAKSLVLIMEDPDVPQSIRADQLYVHWVIYDIPPDTKTIAEHTTPPGIQGKGTNGQTAYMGPCPPDREHRYFFKLYALDTKLNLPKGQTKTEVEKKMQGHIIATAELMGKYVRR